MSKVDAGHYTNVQLNENGDISSTPQKNATEKEINSKCEIQLTYDAYEQLAKVLKETLEARTLSHGKSEVQTLEAQKKTLEESIVNAKKELTDSIKVLTDLTATYDQLKSGMGQNVTRDLSTHADIVNAVKVIRTNLKNAKATIDKLNGGLVSSDVLGKIDASLEAIKKGTVSKDAYLKDIPLGNKVKGKLFTSGLRIKNRNLNGEEGTFVSVNVKNKVFTVEYKVGTETKTIEVSQKDVCLVNDDKNKPKQTAENTKEKEK
ncbi:hypothetical protein YASMINEVIRUS_237 [Yasminevirus sp. GU-2018]|uniref:Uncharacterized protein n=1 Tax=Yasminevirus sp. GU-2018 TaxID=2420051 RepID=A0A5K0U8G2_9VIRU|nr:hypothetical protein YASMINEVIRUS_237 [Yasminevirus sp. GU-2018]